MKHCGDAGLLRNNLHEHRLMKCKGNGDAGEGAVHAIPLCHGLLNFPSSYHTVLKVDPMYVHVGALFTGSVRIPRVSNEN